MVFLIYHPIITSPILSRGLELLCAPQIFNSSTSTIVNLYVVRNKLFPDPMALLETLRFLTFRKQIFQYSFLAQTDQFHYPIGMSEMFSGPRQDFSLQFLFMYNMFCIVLM